MSGRHTFVVAAEVALLAVTLAVVVGMGRLFDGGGWLGQMAASALAAHATAAVLRRRGVSLLGSAVVMVGVAAIVTTWVSYWSTTRIGIPTADTWSAMDADLDTAWSTYQEVVAPTPAVRGFVVAACLALWVVAYIADWAAFRLWVPFEATLPASTLFLFTALLGEEAGRGWAVALFAGSVIGFLLLHRLARQDGSSHWVADRRTAGNRSLLIAGSGLGVLAVVAGSVLWPAVPGSRSVPLVDVAGIGGNDQVRVLSPLVDIRSRLVQQTDVEMFRVQSPVAAYWRLTSLEAFDGQTWKSRGSFGTADGELPESIQTTVASEEFEQSFTITALARIWLPSAYEPRALDIDGTKVRYDESSATLIVDNDASAAEPTTSDGLTYQVTSRSPRITPADLTGTADEIPGDIRDEFLELPEGFSPQVRALAAEIVDDANAATPAQQARALQDHLRNNFRYSLDRQDGHSEDALEDFLFVNRVGYCEQFAGSYAAMARSLGIPSRVAVGFTPGDRDADGGDTFVVRGEYAHAWPEVYIAGAGWVAYEPTPGRGMPGAEPYTDVPEQQAEAGNPGGSEETPTTEPLPTLPTGSTTPPAPRDGPNDDIATGGQGPDDDSSPDSVPERYVLQPIRRVLPILAGLVVAYLLVVPLGMVLRRRRRRQRATSPLEQVDLAWTESVEAAALAGFEERPSDTYVERALRLGEAVPGAADAALTLAARLEVGVYSAEGAEPDDAAVAWDAAAAIEAAAIERASRLARFRRWFDPRGLVRSWRRDRAARQRRITMTPRADLEAERELVGSDDRG